MNKLLVLALLFFAHWAQAKHHHHGSFNAFPSTDILYPSNIVHLNDPQSNVSAEQFVQDLVAAAYGQNGWRVELEHEIQSLAARHYTYGIYWVQWPLLNAQIKVHENQQGAIVAYSTHLPAAIQNTNSIWPGLGQLDSAQLIQSLQLRFERSDWNISHDSVVIVQNHALRAAHRVIAESPRSEYHFQFLLRDNKVIDEHYLPVAFDTTGLGSIYNPDPLTVAETTYGGNYIDNDDQDNISLRLTLDTAELLMTYDNGRFLLRNEFVLLADEFLPSNFIPQNSSGNFFFNRSEPEFESINTLYHLTEFAQYIRSIGYSNFFTEPIRVDPRGAESDNSFFVPTVPPRLRFGIGGVDDAEDADVLVHEFGHYLSEITAPGTRTGNERQSIDEGLADYFAMSYSHALSPYRSTEVFTWDGHNEYWPGRSTKINISYEDYNENDIHNSGSILSGAFTDMHKVFGRERTDQLMLESMFLLAANMSYPDFGAQIMLVNDLAFDGKDACLVQAILIARGMLNEAYHIDCTPNSVASLTLRQDTAICAGDTLRLSAGLDSSQNFYWTPVNLLSDFTATEPLAFPHEKTDYQVYLQLSENSKAGGTIKIDVVNCDTNPVIILNSEGFTERNEPMIVFMAQDPFVDFVEVVNEKGQRVYRNENIITNILEIDGSQWAPGMYFVRVESLHNDFITKKVMKL